jgi:four helix bundle protein
LGISDFGFREENTIDVVLDQGDYPMAETPRDFKDRTKKFAIRVIRLVDSLPRSRSTDCIGHQLLRSATSVGANYRAACRARSDAEFCAKLGIVEEEADESRFWMELLAESGKVKMELLADLLNEANELTAMTVASIKTARQRIPNRKPR